MHPLHNECSNCDTVADDNEVLDRLGSFGICIAKDRAKNAFDPVGDLGAAFSQRYGGPEFTVRTVRFFDVEMFLIPLMFERELLGYFVVGIAAEGDDVGQAIRRWMIVFAIFSRRCSDAAVTNPSQRYGGS